MSTAIELVNTGILMGIIHVLTAPDHLSALATLCGTNVSGEWKAGDKRRVDAFLLGIKWGVGHSIGLLVVGGTLIAIEESSNETIGMDSSWSFILESFVGVFMLCLGVYGMHKAYRHRNESQVATITVESLKLTEEEDVEKEPSTVEMSEKDSIGGEEIQQSSRDSMMIIQQMEDALDSCDSRHGGLVYVIKVLKG